MPGFLLEAAHSSVVFGGKIWVIGGENRGSKNDVWSSADGMNWTQETNQGGFSARRYHSSVVFGSKIWIIGGGSGANPRNDVWSSADGVNWIEVTNDAGFSARGVHSSVVFGGKIWVIGGNDGIEAGYGNSFNDVWSSADGMNWTQVTSNAGFSARTSHSSVVLDQKIWVIGGRDEVWRIKNDVWSSP